MIDRAGLIEAERAIEAALATGDGRGLALLGQGEFSLVVGWPAVSPRCALKRLPVFAGRAAFESYARTFDRYLEALAAAGVRVLETSLVDLERPDGRVSAYAVQPALPAASLAVRSPSREVLEAIAGAARRTVSDRVGLDAQIANWALDRDGLVYLDVTTPLLADEAGGSEVDPTPFLAAFPAPLRAPIRQFVLPGIRRRYHQLRTVLLDLCANLLKERLEPLLPVALEVAREHLGDEPLTEREVRRDYSADARTWAAMLALRRVDRWWQTRVRRRVYPYLLPGRIDR